MATALSGFLNNMLSDFEEPDNDDQDEAIEVGESSSLGGDYHSSTSSLTSYSSGGNSHLPPGYQVYLVEDSDDDDDDDDEKEKDNLNQQEQKQSCRWSTVVSDRGSQHQPRRQQQRNDHGVSRWSADVSPTSVADSSPSSLQVTARKSYSHYTRPSKAACYSDEEEEDITTTSAASDFSTDLRTPSTSASPRRDVQRSSSAGSDILPQIPQRILSPMKQRRVPPPSLCNNAGRRATGTLTSMSQFLPSSLREKAYRHRCGGSSSRSGSQYFEDGGDIGSTATSAMSNATWTTCPTRTRTSTSLAGVATASTSSSGGLDAALDLLSRLRRNQSCKDSDMASISGSEKDIAKSSPKKRSSTSSSHHMSLRSCKRRGSTNSLPELTAIMEDRDTDTSVTKGLDDAEVAGLVSPSSLSLSTSERQQGGGLTRQPRSYEDFLKARSKQRKIRKKIRSEIRNTFKQHLQQQQKQTQELSLSNN